MHTLCKYILLITTVLVLPRPFLFSQSSPDSIDAANVEKIIEVLASDSLKGRGNGRPELLDAAKFIGNRFEKAGLLPLPGMLSYYISFHPLGLKKDIVADKLQWNGAELSANQFIYINPQPGPYPDRGLSHFTVAKLDSSFSTGVIQRWNFPDGPLLLWTDQLQPDGRAFFPESFISPSQGIRREILLVYATAPPVSLALSADPYYYLSATEYNVVGVLPGRSKPDEMIVFSGHYDHDGLRNSKKDSIMNGANDNASGTTGVVALAEYFAKRGDNERTILFCAFAGEEWGLKGSFAFMKHIVAKKIAAVVNIEMIGVPQFGKNKVFITGEDYSSLPVFLRKQLNSAGLKVIDEPDASKMLFKRSDNLPFALEGIPAHTIMSSDDDEECYHRPCDELDRINITHLTTIIRAIARATQPLIDGKETPSRIRDGGDLR